MNIYNTPKIDADPNSTEVIEDNTPVLFKVVDEIIREPLGGAHRNHKQAAIRLKKSLRKNLKRLTQVPLAEFTRLREKKFREMGKVAEAEN